MSAPSINLVGGDDNLTLALRAKRMASDGHAHAISYYDDDHNVNKAPCLADSRESRTTRVSRERLPLTVVVNLIGRKCAVMPPASPLTTLAPRMAIQ